MLHTPALWHFDISVIFRQGFHRVKFVIVPPYFVWQQYLWNIAIQLAVGCSAYKLIYLVWVAHHQGKNNWENETIVQWNPFRETGKISPKTHKLCHFTDTVFMNNIFNSWRPSVAIWQQKTGSTMAQEMACCLTAPSHYLNQCWHIISKVLWLSCEGNITIAASIINH